jgi:glyoxylase-like metal-dependent hydrolase (beta-lactamase superfamily II)
MKTSVEVIIHPVCLRFSYHNNEIVYMFASNPEQQLDEMEKLMGVETDQGPIFDSNVGFLPVASTILIRGEKTILVDPGNYHIGFYSMLKRALNSKNLTYEDIDIIVTTHTHADHAAAIVHFRDKPWVIGEGEFKDFEAIEGKEIVEAKKKMMGDITEIRGDGETEIMKDVIALKTPGHTSGHISLIVNSEDKKVLIAGDQTMTRSEYTKRTFSRWYPKQNLLDLNKSLDKVQKYKPDLVIPGHDRPFCP